MKRCRDCGATAVSRTRENHRYTASGLSNVTLLDIEIDRCAACGDFRVRIPRVEDLHRALATAIAEKPGRLAPEEVRYLRKYLGLSGTDFASKMGVTPSQVSRWETGAASMGAVSERLLRLLIAYAAPVNDYLEKLDAVADTGADDTPLRMGLRLQRSHWRSAA